MNRNNLITVKTNDSIIPVYDMKIGDFGVIVDDFTYDGEIVLMTFAGLISLTKPNHTWTPVRKGSSLKVRVFPDGSEITIKIRD